MANGGAPPLAQTRETFIFPLNTVLFPGGVLPLNIFEQRYLEMTKICISENRPFGVCLIKEGEEVGTPAVPQEIGCLARITQWDMPHLGVFHLLTEGTQRFRIMHSNAGKSGLISAAIEILPDDSTVAPQNPLCGEVLKAIIEKVGAEHFPSPHRFDDAAWIGYRLSEVLPISLDTRQQLLQIADPQMRLAQLNQILSRQACVPGSHRRDA
jgi:Lon protease-like protein